MKGLSLASRRDSLVCPLCEAGGLRSFDNDSMRCGSCGAPLGGAMLETLRRITDLPEVLGRYSCECGHPETRCLPDGVSHCPACGSEVLPVDAHATLSEPAKHGEAWWAGWMDGHVGEMASFVDNPNLARHRAGREVRRDRSAPLLARARTAGP